MRKILAAHLAVRLRAARSSQAPLKARSSASLYLHSDLQIHSSPQGESAVIPRYTGPRWPHLDDENRFRTWLAVEVAATETLAEGRHRAERGCQRLSAARAASNVERIFENRGRGQTPTSSLSRHRCRRNQLGRMPAGFTTA